MQIGGTIVKNRRQLTLAASCFLVASLILVQLYYPWRKQKTSPAACIGSEAAIVERKEDYVRNFVDHLSQEARSEDSSDKVRGLP